MVNKEIDKFGNVRYFNDIGSLHREDGPAVEWAGGDKEWYINGLKHRLDGPAVLSKNKYWYINDQLHRLGGPAEDYASGCKGWWKKGKRHRLNAPAIIRPSGVTTKEWYEFGVFKRSS